MAVQSRVPKNLLAWNQYGILEPPWTTYGDSILTPGQPGYSPFFVQSSSYSSVASGYANRIGYEFIFSENSACYYVIAKSGVTSVFYLRIYNVVTATTVSRIIYDLSAGTYVLSIGYGRMSSVGNGWYICEAYGQCTPGHAHQLSVYNDNPNGSIYLSGQGFNYGIYKEDFDRAMTTEVPRT